MKRGLFSLYAGLLVAAAATAVLGQDPPVPPPPTPPAPTPTGGPAKPVQNIVLDRTVRAGDLILYADQSDDKAYYYLSDKPRLALNENGNPEFSFLRWVENKPGGEPEGGGLIHAVISLAVTEDQLQQARSELQRLKPGARIIGPVTYSSGTIALVSSIADPSGKVASQVLGLTKAPLLDGQKVAVSVLLTKFGAKLLWESFQTPTPDISFRFEMQLDGYTAPFKAKLVADWDRIYKHTTFQAGLAHKYLAGEINLAFDQLRQDGAIKLEQTGTDSFWDSKVQDVYGRLIAIMFDAAPAGEQAPAAASGGGSATPPAGTSTAADGSPLGRVNAMLAANQQAVRERNAQVRMENEMLAAKNKMREEMGLKPLEPRKEEKVPSWALYASFQMKRQRKSGKFEMDLNKYTAASLPMQFSQNVGDLRRLMRNTDHFREVNLDHPLYVQREIAAYLDGLNAADFDKYVNFATVQMRKRHAKGAVTDAELRIDRSNFNQAGNQFKMLYGWKDDNERSRWLEYEYRTVWSFFGGRQVETPWAKTQNSALPLVPPYQRRTLVVEAAPAFVEAQAVRAITVRVFYNLGAGEQVRQTTLNAFKNVLSGQVEFMLPPDQPDYGYEVLYQLKGNRTVSTGRQRAVSDLLVLEELPGA